MRGQSKSKLPEFCEFVNCRNKARWWERKGTRYECVCDTHRVPGADASLPLDPQEVLRGRLETEERKGTVDKAIA